MLQGPTAEDDPDLVEDDDGTDLIVHQAADYFNPANLSREYYRTHKQKFMLVPALSHWDGDKRTIPVSRKERMDSLLSQIQLGNFLFFIRPNEVLVGDAAKAFMTARRESDLEIKGYYIEVVDMRTLKSRWEFRLVRVVPELTGFDDEGLCIQTGSGWKTSQLLCVKILNFER